LFALFYLQKNESNNDQGRFDWTLT